MKKKTKFKFAGVLLIAAFMLPLTPLSLPSSAQRLSEDELEYVERTAFDELSQALIDLQPYMTVDPETKITVFDEETARTEGVKNQLIGLAIESVQYQNLLMQQVQENLANGGDGDITQLEEISLNQFPRLRRFNNRARAHLRRQQRETPTVDNAPDPANPGRGRPESPGNSENNPGRGNGRKATETEQVSTVDIGTDESSIAAVIWQTCGNWGRPIPNYTPSRIRYNSNTPRTALEDYGFHRTTGYACGGDPFVPCEFDYTRARSYTGSFGTCDSPLFRDHGNAGGANAQYPWFSIQFAEPNPEVHAAWTWPYWNWPSYVKHWHDTY